MTLSTSSIDYQNLGNGVGLLTKTVDGTTQTLAAKTLIGGPGIVLKADNETIYIEYVGYDKGAAIPFAKLVEAPSTINALGILYGTAEGRLSFTSSPTIPNSVLTYDGRAIRWADVPMGTVTDLDITAGAGIIVEGEKVTSSGAFGISLAPSGVVAGVYLQGALTIDAYGRVVSASEVAFGTIRNGRSLGDGAAIYTGTSDDALLFRSIVGAGNASVSTDGDVITVRSSGVTHVAIEGHDGIAVSGEAITSQGTIDISLTPTGVVPGMYAAPMLMIDDRGRITAAASTEPGEINEGRSLGGAHAVFLRKEDKTLLFRSIATGGALTASTSDEELKLSVDIGVSKIELVGGPGIEVLGGTVTSAGKVFLNLTSTGVQPGTYLRPTISVDETGRLSKIETADPEPQVSIHVEAGSLTVTDGPAYQLNLATTSVRPGTYDNPSITVDSYGRVTNITSGSANVKTIETPIAAPYELPDTGVIAGTYQDAMITIDAKGRVTRIEPDAPRQLAATGVVPGRYENATLQIDADGRISAVSSNTTISIPANGKPNQVLQKTGTGVAWSYPATKIIPKDVPPSHGWRILITEADGDGMLALSRLEFRSHVGGAAIPFVGRIECNVPGWGPAIAENVLHGDSGTYVPSVTFNPKSECAVGFRFDDAVVVRDVSITCGGEDYRAPISFDVQYLAGADWATAWSVKGASPWQPFQNRSFPSTKGPSDEAFRTLADTPQTYAGAARSIVRVNDTESGLEFVAEDRRFGRRDERPSYRMEDIGKTFFDTTLGRPIWWSGRDWVLCDGTLA